jgi:hypothetical protein
VMWGYPAAARLPDAPRPGAGASVTALLEFR